MFKKYKIVQYYNGTITWYVYRRHLLFFWKYETYYISFKDALEYVGMHSANVFIEPTC